MKSTKEPENGPLSTAAVSRSDGTMQNCTAPLYHAPDDDARLWNAFLDALADKLAEKLRAAPKDVWTARDLAERYGVSPSTIRQRMNAGEFGEVIRVDGRSRVVPWEGVQLFDRTHRVTEGGRLKAAYRPKRLKNGRVDPGPI